jgi:site-specific recombinase XerC
LRLRVLPELGAVRLWELTSADVQAFVDRLLGSGANAGTVRNSLMPLRAICRRAKSRGDVAVNPTRGVELPAVRGSRDRIASAQEAAELLAALTRDQALWATAVYAGLRHGELLGLVGLRRLRARGDPRAPVVGRGRGLDRAASRGPAIASC